MKKVAVVGGGIAGITAALSAAKLGRRVTLMEKRSRLGGRLGSFLDKRTGCQFDLGAHLIIGGYTNTLKLLKMIDIRDAVDIQRNLFIPFHHPEMGRSELRAAGLPSPFNFLAGIFNFRLLTMRERINLTKRLKKLASTNPLPPQTAQEWLHSASRNEYEWFWKPLIISALNCYPEDVDIRMLRVILVKGFMKRGGLGVFLQSEEEIFHNSALKALKRERVTVKLGQPVRGLKISKGRIQSLFMDSGESVQADNYIFALPPDALGKVFGSEIPAIGLNLDLSAFQYSNIVNVHLIFERRIFEEEFGCILDTLPQWFFHRRWSDVSDKGEVYSLVISAAERAIPPGCDIIKVCLNDLKRCGADLRGNRLLYHKIVNNKKATVKISPDIVNKRPGVMTDLANLYLAGDWVDTGLPPTIESAVLSGFRAGEAV